MSERGITGVFGGSFNPPHLAHLVCAQEAHLQLALDRVLLVPTRIPPHKPMEVEPGAEHRLEMCRRAIAGHVTVDGVFFEGERIPLTIENGRKLTDAVAELCRSHSAREQRVLVAGG